MKKSMKFFWLNIFALAFLFAGIAVQSAEAQNGWLPPGSYQKSCSAMSAKGLPDENRVSLWGLCNPPGNSFPNITSLDDFYLCDGDIANIKGNLQCSKNENSKLMQAAKAVVKNGLQKATGKQPSEQEIANTLRQMMVRGYAAQFFAGLKQSDADAFLNQNVADLSNASARAEIIKQAFYDAWGFKNIPSATFAKWDAAIKSSGGIKQLLSQASGQFKTAYEQVLNGETADINKDAVSKKLVVMNAYKAAVGRPTTQGELQLWASGRTGIYFRQIVNSLRGTMHQPVGAKLLVEMYKNVLTCKGVTNPTNEQINQVVVNNSANKSVYLELCPN